MKLKIVYCCMDCGMIIDFRTALHGKARCKKCSLKYQVGKGNPMYGRKLKATHPFKTIKFGKDHPCYGLKKPEHSKRMQKVKNPNYKHGDFCKKYCKICKKEISCLSSTGLCREHFILTILMKRTYSRYLYKNIFFKSSWEANFAKWCDLSGIKWEYEPKAFRLRKGFYLPDFYLPEFDIWIEIKGYMSDYARWKMKTFKRIYKKETLYIYNFKELHNLSVI